MAEETDQITETAVKQDLVSLDARKLEERSVKERNSANISEELAEIIPSAGKEAGDQHEIADGLHEAALIVEEQFRNQLESDDEVEPVVEVFRPGKPPHWNSKDN